MKRVSKLLICSLIMIFGLLFYTDVFAGEDTVTAGINVRIYGKNTANS